jgi:hypothetical protein
LLSPYGEEKKETEVCVCHYNQHMGSGNLGVAVTGTNTLGESNLHTLTFQTVAFINVTKFQPKQDKWMC